MSPLRRLVLAILTGFAVLSGTLAAVFSGEILIAWAFPIGLGICLVLAAAEEVLDG